jgi:transcriptional regulator with XRE-family HTH domain
MVMNMAAPKSKRTKVFRKKDGPSDIDTYIGQSLRARRNLLGMTQEELADAVGVTFQQIQKYELAKNRISASRLYQFAVVLGTKIGYFFESIDAAPKKNLTGLSESQQGYTAADIMSSKETTDLVRTYYSIQDPVARRNLFKLVRQMALTLKDPE